MRWRKFNGETIHLPIKDAVEEAIKRETSKGIHLKVCIGTDSQVKGNETEFATVIVFCVNTMAGLCTSTMKKQNNSLTLKNECCLKLQRASRLLMSFVIYLFSMMLTWKCMLILTQNLNLKVTTHFVKQ